MKVVAESRLASSSMGKRFVSSSRKTATQLGSRPTTGDARLDLRPERVEDLRGAVALAVSSMPKS